MYDLVPLLPGLGFMCATAKFGLILVHLHSMMFAWETKNSHLQYV